MMVITSLLVLICSSQSIIQFTKFSKWAEYLAAISRFSRRSLPVRSYSFSRIVLFCAEPEVGVDGELVGLDGGLTEQGLLALASDLSFRCPLNVSLEQFGQNVGLVVGVDEYLWLGVLFLDLLEIPVLGIEIVEDGAVAGQFRIQLGHLRGGARELFAGGQELNLIGELNASRQADHVLLVVYSAVDDRSSRIECNLHGTSFKTLK